MQPLAIAIPGIVLKRWDTPEARRPGRSPTHGLRFSSSSVNLNVVVVHGDVILIRKSADAPEHAPCQTQVLV